MSLFRNIPDNFVKLLYSVFCMPKTERKQKLKDFKYLKQIIIGL